jgi:hypothetical protein
MSFLYRHALFVSRKQPYLDWANGSDNSEGALTDELSKAHRKFWEEIFTNELGAWIIAEDAWPSPRTRETFGQGFDVELNDAVYDLAPEEPLTQHEVDQADLAKALGECAACGIEVDEGAGRFASFTVSDRSRLALFQGRVYLLPINDDEVVPCIVTGDDSEGARAGEDLLVRVCSSRCEKQIRSVVPKALRRWSRRYAADE